MHSRIETGYTIAVQLQAGKNFSMGHKDEIEIQPLSKDYDHVHTAGQVLIPNLVWQHRRNFGEKQRIKVLW